MAAQRAGLPTTVEGFRGHALYCLKRHITKYQVWGGGCRAAHPGNVCRGNEGEMGGLGFVDSAVYCLL